MNILLKKKRISILAVFLFTAFQCYAQSRDAYSPAMPNVIPPAPTSRVMQKFLGYPISYATGTIDINVPLYTLRTSMLSIPLELKYHSSGVRAQDPAGIVGRSWSLFPGFKISRTIMGKPDEVYPVVDKGHSPSIPDQIALASPYKSDDCRDNLGNLYTRMDGQYDIFQIHMPGIEASFILKQLNGTDVVEMLSEKPLIITPKFDTNITYLPYRLYGFEIKNDKGIRYVFGEASPLRNTTPNYVEQTAGIVYNCGWMLREIIFPNGEKVTFSYQKVTESVQAFNQSIIVLDNGRPYIHECVYDWMINDNIGSDSPWWRILGSEGYTNTYSDGPVMPYSNYSLAPLQIVAPNGSVNFAYTSNMLTSIQVNNNLGTRAKSIEFTYSNMISKLLKKVALSGEGDYRFIYNEEDNLSVAASGIDWWGYYNGTTVSNGNYFPRMTMDVIASRGSISYPMNITLGGGANRQPAASCMDYRALTEIIYPTQGKLNITYQPHSYSVDGVQKTGGGLRVQSTASYDPVSGKTITRRYQYADAHFTPKRYPDERSMVTVRQLCTLDEGTCMVRQRVVSIFPSHEHIRGNNTPVWYGKITETSGEGMTEYIYDYKPDEYNNANAVDVNPSAAVEYQMSQLNRYVYPAPWLVSETHYRKNGNQYEKAQQTVNTYVGRVSKIAVTMALPYMFPYNGNSNCRFMDELFRCSNVKRYYEVFGSPIRHTRYYISKGWQNVGSTTRTTYEGNDSILERTQYTYDTARPYNISRKTILTSDGDELIEKYYYSNNTIPNLGVLTSSQQSAINNLTTQNRLTAVVQQSLEKNGVQLNSIIYGFYNNTLCLPENIYYQKLHNTFDNRVFFRYDQYGNPVYILKDGEEKFVYLWSYKGAYPVAEIRNATYDQVKSALNGTLPESLSELASPNTTTINGLRARLTDASVTTYVYKPLIGIESMTDSKGITTYYDYDTFGRLKESYYKEGSVKRILESYKYNYKNP